MSFYIVPLFISCERSIYNLVTAKNNYRNFFQIASIIHEKKFTSMSVILHVIHTIVAPLK